MSKTSTETDGNIYIYINIYVCFETDTEIWQAQANGWGHNWASTSP